jgi:membrane-associated phospholipid phosphatase
MRTRHRNTVLSALGWWIAGVLLGASALLLTEPSTAVYRAVAQADLDWPELLADVLILGLMAWFGAGMWWARRSGPSRTATGLAAAVGVVVAYGSSEMFKLLLAQDRPCRSVLPDPQCPGVGNWSFPSNHATIAFAVATAVVLVLTRWWTWIAYLAALVAASSRVVDGVHFPHDVLAGAALGIGTTVACSLVLGRWTRPLAAHLCSPAATRSS